MVICLQMGKNLMTKTPPGDFQVTILETPLRLRHNLLGLSLLNACATSLSFDGS